jgi:transcription elongation factor GreA
VRKKTGLTGSIIVEPVVASPPTHVVDLPDGAAEGAFVDAPAPGGGMRRAGVAPRAASGGAPRRAAPRAASGPRAPSKASIARAGRLAEPVHLTADGVARLAEELRVLVEVQRPQVIARIRTAKELGDLKENADYTSAREEQSFLEGRIQAIEAQLRDARIIEAPAAGSRIGLGSSVTVETLGEETTYVLVGSTEADPAQGRISVASPVGRALLGHGPGDEVVIRTPRGEATYRVLGVG